MEKIPTQEYYGCNCDKYNPDCKCNPKPTRYTKDFTLRSIEQIEAEIKTEQLKLLDNFSTEELIAELKKRFSYENTGSSECGDI